MCSFLKSDSEMAQKKDEIALNTNAITQTTTKVHRILWTIENVSKLPLGTLIEGPDFYPTKTCLFNIAFQKSEMFLYVYLRNKSDGIIHIERSLILADCKGTTLHHDKMGSVNPLPKNKYIDVISPVAEIQRFDALEDDILVIDCCLKMEGSIATEISLLFAQRKDEIASDNTNAITQTTTKVHRILWTIENVSKLPLGTLIEGPDFYPTKTCLFNIAFQKSEMFLYVYLRNKSDRNIHIERSLILADCKGTTLHHDKMGSFGPFQKNKYIDVISPVAEIKWFEALEDDILVIDCCLKMEGSISTEISLFKSELESREHLINDLNGMINNAVDSDFTFQIGGDYIYSHRSLLRARSVYFKERFETEMEESAENSISINDVSYIIMYQLVKFLYTGGLAETFEYNNIQHMSNLYLAADQFKVMDMKAVCADRLMFIATVNNIYEILKLAHGHKDKDLKTRAMNFISLHFNELNRDAFKTFTDEEHYLASEVLNVVYKNL